MVSDNHPSEIYQSIVVPVLSEDVDFEATHSRFKFGGRGGCSIAVVCGVVQVVQNWFTGIPNPSRGSRLG